MSTKTAISERFLDARTAINSKYRIDAYLAEHGIRVASNKQVRCPLHDDSTPSFSVDLERNIWHCFGCPDGGHFIDLFIRYTNKQTGSNLNIYSAVESILAKDVELQRDLGYTSIYRSENEDFDLFRKEGSTQAFEEQLQQKIHIKPVNTDCLHKVIRAVHNEGIERIIEFIADCQDGMSEQQLISKYLHKQDNLDDFIVSLREDTEDYTKMFLEALETL